MLMLNQTNAQKRSVQRSLIKTTFPSKTPIEKDFPGTQFAGHEIVGKSYANQKILGGTMNGKLGRKLEIMTPAKRAWN